VHQLEPTFVHMMWSDKIGIALNIYSGHIPFKSAAFTATTALLHTL